MQSKSCLENILLWNHMETTESKYNLIIVNKTNLN